MNTGIIEILTRRCAIILEVLSCSYTIHVKAPTKYAMKTGKLAEEAYARTHVPVKIHKMFFHETQSVNCQ